MPDDSLSEKQLKKRYQKLGHPDIADCLLISRRSLAVTERRKKLMSFQAYQECPSCQKYNFHLMKSGIHHGFVIRECSECGYEWKQK